MHTDKTGAKRKESNPMEICDCLFANEYVEMTAQELADSIAAKCHQDEDQDYIDATSTSSDDDFVSGEETCEPIEEKILRVNVAVLTLLGGHDTCCWQTEMNEAIERGKLYRQFREEFDAIRYVDRLEEDEEKLTERKRRRIEHYARTHCLRGTRISRGEVVKNVCMRCGDQWSDGSVPLCKNPELL